MNNIFDFRDQLIDEYSDFSRSFAFISATDIKTKVKREYEKERYWPQPLIQINPNYQRAQSVQELAEEGLLHPKCAEIFRVGKSSEESEYKGYDLFLFKHQMDALAKAKNNKSYVVTTGTGSGKSLSFFIPIVDAVLKAKDKDPTPKTRAIIIYPMNALANSQLEEVNKFLVGYRNDDKPFSVARYTGQESAEERKAIADNPPDILLTNFMMLELILTRYENTDRHVVENCQGLEFLVLDELHTYRGRQGADVAVLVRRLREKLNAQNMVCIGTSATMSSTGKLEERNRVVANVASKLFGTPISKEEIIGETLERVTTPSKGVHSIKAQLKDEVETAQFSWASYEAFVDSPMAIWVELNLGIEIPDDEPPKRATPKTLDEASKLLEADAEVDEQQAKKALQNFLVAANEMTNPAGRAPFAFKLHQFISGPGKVLATLEPAGLRTITLDAQRFAPGKQGEQTLLYAAHFCRDCGEEYHPVWQSEGENQQFIPREINDIALSDDEQSFGYLCPITPGQVYQGSIEQLPEDWLELNRAEPRLKKNYRERAPYEVKVDPQGMLGRGESYWFIPGKFRFCVACGTAHDAHGKDSNRLASLSGEGRSSATTMLTLSALRQLFAIKELPKGLPDPRKLLGFSDNRQDAALQAGHFNDFIYLLTLRAGLIGALQNNQGALDETSLADEVFNALGFNKTDYATLSEYLKNPKAIGFARKEAQSTLRFILGYRLLRDLRRGWRFNNPNLNQLGLLEINYKLLDDFTTEEQLFAESSNTVLRKLKPHNRATLYKLLLDEMHMGLCIDSRYLDGNEQDRARNKAFSEINERWAFQTDENLEQSRYLITKPMAGFRARERASFVSAAPRSRILKVLKKADFWKNTSFAEQVREWKDDEWVDLVEHMLATAAKYGYVHQEAIADDFNGYRLNASVLEWRLPEPKEDSEVLNQYFRALYLNLANLLQKDEHPLFVFEAQEHTAQVDSERRQTLEQRFRYTNKDKIAWEKRHGTPLERLPVMFCSPTMELGVDISALNTVFLRNVPPTPANYAQRSGRAGRSGQQALVITYCASLSPHDQWFFHHANDMVHGVVQAPTLDLSNRELVESHLHAVWLSEAATELESNVSELLDLGAENKPVKKELMEKLSQPEVIERAKKSAQGVINHLEQELKGTYWFSEDYLEQVIGRAPENFDLALNRWRLLYEATQKQMEMANNIAQSHAATHQERETAKRRWSDASSQHQVLLQSSSRNSDFYTYRYLASQGFLPGYNFPRLPLMAWIPGGRGKRGGQENAGSMVSRPRFLALSEFGPRSLIYHQGRMYRVNRAKLDVSSTEHISGSGQLATIRSRICSQCGYGHLGEEGSKEHLTELCENCGALLTEGDWIQELYRIETVETQPVERISANEEERQRQGFELQTTYRFLPGPDGKIQQDKARVLAGENQIAELTYSPAARIWRINKGWRRRKDKNQYGFFINPLSGLWSKQDDPNDDGSPETAEERATDSVRSQRIVPFVEDHRNLLILSPKRDFSLETMATVQAALKRGIEVVFQIEESELVAEPLPTLDERKSLLFYEAAEGGAGVLTRLANEPESLAQVASKALEIMHFIAPEEGEWEFAVLQANEKKDELGNALCEAGCYQCLLSYFNQPDHDAINRRDDDALMLLVALANANVEPEIEAMATATNSQDAINDKLTQWLAALDAHELSRPDAMNLTVGGGAATAAGQYKTTRTLVFLEQIPTDIATQLKDKGWQILDFSEQEQWPALFEQHAKLLHS